MVDLNPSEFEGKGLISRAVSFALMFNSHIGRKMCYGGEKKFTKSPTEVKGNKSGEDIHKNKTNKQTKKITRKYF